MVNLRNKGMKLKPEARFHPWHWPHFIKTRWAAAAEGPCLKLTFCELAPVSRAARPR